ncbi:MAG: NAD(P)H-hydrate dehydratase [Candidatus Cloacimonadales bacterium]
MLNPKKLVLSRQEMTFADQYTSEQLKIPGQELMEKAGLGCSKKIRQLLKALKFELSATPKIAIFCGAGNNGGDGFVIARYLVEWGFSCQIFLLGNPEKMSAETKQNYEICQERKIPLLQLSEQLPELQDFQVVVDAIFGIGLQGQVRGFAAEVIQQINRAQKLCIAIDIPSGVDADTGAGEICSNCYCTLSMAARKYGHLLGQGQRASGEVFVIDIGIPDLVFQQFPARAYLLSDESVQYPERSRFAHKGDFGKLGLIAGSRGFSGAAVLAAKAALRAGGGLVTLFHPAGLADIFEIKLTEVMTQTLETDSAKLFAQLQNMDLLLIGPGIGQAATTRQMLHYLLENWQKKIVLDADALNIIAAENWQHLLDNRQLLITPHIGEFARLSNCSIAEIQADPLAKIEQFLDQYNCSLLLKSATTIYADAQHLIFDDSGNDGLATGGSGDLLAGIIASFLGQKLPLWQAAPAASYLLGKTAEKLANSRKPASIIPSDILDEIFKY